MTGITKSPTAPRLIYFSPYSSGGLADYSHEQAGALKDVGMDVCCLTTPEAARSKPNARYDRRPVLITEPNRSTCPSRLKRRFRSVRCILGNAAILAKYIQAGRINQVLFGAYNEYFSPLWVSQFRSLAQRGVVFGSVVHDPSRDFVLGPLWWHRWSTKLVYSFLREAFVHDAVDIDTVKPMPNLRTTVIPHGPYFFPLATETRAAMRQRLNIPDNAKLLLAFGHIRDTKNLDLAIRALARCPDFYLLVAGRELGERQRPVSYYQKLAGELGVVNRCRWENRFIVEQEVGNLFEAADLLLLTYSARFSSASGVLNVAANFQKPCLASGGRSNLRSMMEKYSLGFWIAPDSVDAIADGLTRWLRETPKPDWSRYLAENSWRRNAELVAECMFAGVPILNEIAAAKPRSAECLQPG